MADENTGNGNIGRVEEVRGVVLDIAFPERVWRTR